MYSLMKILVSTKTHQFSVKNHLVFHASKPIHVQQGFLIHSGNLCLALRRLQVQSLS